MSQTYLGLVYRRFVKLCQGSEHLSKNNSGSQTCKMILAIFRVNRQAIVNKCHGELGAVAGTFNKATCILQLWEQHGKT